jgi:hypothetical protein
MSTYAPDATVADQVKLAAQAYIYGYPLVYDLHEVAAFVAGSDRFPMQAPFNAFGHARQLAGPDFAFVSPNNDTVYSIAMCDVRQEPLVLHVPDTAGRYYVLQFIDAWTNNIAYVGSRATGTGEAEFLLAASGYADDPGGMQLVEVPGGVCTIAGRIQVDGDDDLPLVHSLQDSFTLTALSLHQGGSTAKPPAGLPAPDPRVPDELAWWEQFRVALAAFPPPAGDAPYLDVCKRFGLLEAESPYVELDPKPAHVLVEGAKAGQAQVEELMQQIHATPEGWQSAMHLFDYNLDRLGLGTIDAAEWKIADRATAYATRAVAARAGLWGNHGYEADYAVIWTDADGNKLDGNYNYELRLPTAPPVDAFWSLTMYDGSDFYLVANPMNRYSIGDRTPGLKRGDDGSITIHIGNASPGKDRESNWLPAPAAPFRPCIRMYQPREDILDDTYVLPAIVRTGPSTQN